MSINWNEISSSRPVKFLIKTSLLLAILFLLLSAAVTVFPGEHFSREEAKIPLLIGKALFFVDVADNNRERRIGLSRTNELRRDEGMLFVFESEGKRGIWMKDMNFAIDILWIDKKFKIVHIEKEVSPKTYPKIFVSSSDSRYVLELKAGSVDREDIYIGSRIDFNL
jgi:uncharacterized protein